MPASLVESQFATLEALQPDEAGFALDLDQPVDNLVVQAVEALTARGVVGTPAPSTRPAGPASAGKEA
jgi:gluconokinase